MVIVVLPGCLPRALGVLPHESVNKMGKKGKMPPALKAYWAAKRGAKRMVKHTMARKGRRSGKSRIPLLGVMAAGALALGVVARGNGKFQYAGSPVGYLKEGKWADAASAAGRNMTDAGTYLPMIAPLGALVILRLVGARVPLGRRASLA